MVKKLLETQVILDSEPILFYNPLAMRQEQERFISAPLGVDTNPPGRWNGIDASGYDPLQEGFS